MSAAGKKNIILSKRTLDNDDDVDSSDDLDMDYVPSRSLLRRNVAESGDERMSDGSGVERNGSFDAMKNELESGMDKVEEHAQKLSGATEKSIPTVITGAAKSQMDLFENEWPNVQPLVECPKPECGAVNFFTKAGTARCGQIINCSKCHKRVTGEQVTKLLEQCPPEPEASTTVNAAGNQESESLASLLKRLLREVSSLKETIDALCHENTAMKAKI